MEYKYFTDKELSCKCCGENRMDDSFMKYIVHARWLIGKPFIVASAYRCPDYNNKVSSTGLDGPHTTGRAIDIKCDSRLRYELLSYFMNVCMTRFGFGEDFIHIDNLTELYDCFDDKVIWTYS